LSGRKDIFFLSHGGPIATPEDAAYVNAHTDCVGFVGASSLERLGVVGARLEVRGVHEPADELQRARCLAARRPARIGQHSAQGVGRVSCTHASLAYAYASDVQAAA